jgi:tetratricopeptide (TPR) repeat protein
LTDDGRDSRGQRPTERLGPGPPPAAAAAPAVVSPPPGAVSPPPPAAVPPTSQPPQPTLRLEATAEEQGPPPPSGIRLAPGEMLANRFRVVRFIGHGGMGDVYEAEDLELGERVALKTVRPAVAHLSGAIDRFRREIHLSRKVTHPNVCRIYDVFRHRPEGSGGVAGGTPVTPAAEITFFSMELLPGETLEQRLRSGGRMTPEEALPIVRQVAAGLTAAHRVGVIHRDFKPGNVMLCGGGGIGGELRAVITDFGLARTFGEGENLTVHGAILGTPSYMAPEQVTGGEVTASTDIYSLGCVLYEMVTGAPPFVGANSFSTAFKRVQEDPRPPHQHVPGLDPAWDAAILRCLERDPADRFAQASDVAAALGGEEFALGPRRRRRLRRRALVAAAALFVLAVLAVLVALTASGAFGGRREPGAARGPAAAVRSSVMPLADLFRTPEALYADGMKLLGKLDAARAEEQFDKAVGARKDYWLAHSGLAVALADLGHDDRAGPEAKLAFDHAASLPPDERLLVTARYWQVGGRWDKAAESYQELRSSSPGDVDVGLGLVRALAGAGRGSDALQVVSSLKVRPEAAAAASRLDLAEAEVQKALADFPREGQAARRAREQAERDGDDLVAARALCFEAGALGHLGDRQGALEKFKKAAAVYAGAADQRNLAQVLWATAGILYYQGNFELARAKAKEAVDTFKDVGDLRGQSRALDTLAAIEGSQGNLAGAQSRYTTAIENYRRLGDRAQEAEATGNLGLTLKMLGRNDEAAKQFEHALALFQQLQNRSGEAAQLFWLAGVSYNQLNLEKAASYLAQAESLATAIDDQTRIVDALAFEADLAAARGDLVGERRKREEALTRGRGLGDKNLIAQSQVALAELELDKGHPSQAQEYAQEALNHFREERMPDDEAEAHAALARALLAQHSPAEARAAIEMADRLAAKSRQPQVRIMVALVKARLDEADKPAEALKVLEDALAQAQAAGLGPDALDVRLAMGEIDAKHGNRQRAAERLVSLENDARSHGFVLIADRAARARAGGAGPETR